VRTAAAREALEEAGVEVESGDFVHVATNRHETERPTVGIWFAARLVDPNARPVAGGRLPRRMTAGDDAVAAGWYGAHILEVVAASA
jgi:8-oxo-dGTP pyrophosphatase MutT (NUDIX family)